MVESWAGDGRGGKGWAGESQAPLYTHMSASHSEGTPRSAALSGSH